jgi:hypothetical protein
MNGRPPWDEPGWLGHRLREFLWQGLSWPYVVAITFTASALQTRDPAFITASLGMWSIALGRRVIQRGLDAWTAANERPLGVREDVTR